MSRQNSYIINFGRLGPGKHDFVFDIDADFFQQFDYSIIQNCQTSTKVQIDKTRLNLMNLTFSINGTVDLACDRCLEVLPYPVSTQYKLLVKLEETSERDPNEDDDILFLSPSAYEIDVTNHIYEFHSLSIPFKKECLGTGTQCQEVDKRIGGISEETEFDKGTDPRWDDLKKLL